MGNYYCFNKPYGVLSSFTDPEGRATLKNYIQVPGIYAVGRLDLDSEGLLLLMDDGWLNHRLTDPRFNHPKTYWIQVEGVVTRAALDQLERGLVIQGYKTRPSQVRGIPEPDLFDRVKPITPHGPTDWIEMCLVEGKKRQIRHMTAAVGLPTLRLIRSAIGVVQLGSLAPGQLRPLTGEEILALKQSVK